MDDILQTPHYQYSSTDYGSLMTFRIRRILMVCSRYDEFILKEDGMIENEIYREYVDLGLSSPPKFIWANNSADAARMIREDKDIDMVICMYNAADRGIFHLAVKAKEDGIKVPFILLTNFSKETQKRLSAEDMSGIDYRFTWHGSADLILAIVKLIEDSQNAEHDMLQVGVQAIILVEDSVRFYSTYLPALYKIILRQSKEFFKDSLNDWQLKQRKRSRPKILFATNLKDAEALYQKFNGNILGVITDVDFAREPGGEEVEGLGLDFAREVLSSDDRMPVLVQSSREEVEAIANGMGARFLKKYSKTLILQLTDYIIEELCYGDFIFRDNEGNEIGRAGSLKEFEQVLNTIPDDIFLRYTSRNMLSKWFFARGFFDLASTFKKFRRSQFESTQANRQNILNHLHDFLSLTGRGIVAEFDPESYARYIWFARLGNGSLGGKARGLAFLGSIIQQHDLTRKYEDVKISIPRTVVVTTEYFDQFIVENGLQYVIDTETTDEEVLSEFVSSRLPNKLLNELEAYLKTVRAPLAIRSSSKLEDSTYQPFAGVYSTYMIPLVENKDQMLRMLGKAIKSIYASVFFKGSRNYIQTTGNLLSEEKMAVVIQTICGSTHDGFYYPMMSGVARSENFYPIDSEKMEDGVVNVAFGLGKMVVDGGNCLRFVPTRPKKILQLSEPKLALRDTQKEMYGLDLRPGSFKTSVDDSINLVKMPVGQALEHYAFPELVASTFSSANNRLMPGINGDGARIVSFDAILRYSTIPLAKMLKEIMEICKQALMSEVEIEFAVDPVDINGERTYQMKLLQVRPAGEYGNNTQDVAETMASITKPVVCTDKALGCGCIRDMKYLVLVDPEKFNSSNTVAMASAIERINASIHAEGAGYALIGPGRWGSSDPWLGIPVAWSNISEARVIVEYSIPGFQIEPSQGTHFFQNLTSLGVGYLTADTVNNPESIDFDALRAFEDVSENYPECGDLVKIYLLPEDFTAVIDRSTGKAVMG